MIRFQSFLLVESDTKLRQLLTKYLGVHNHIFSATNAAEARALLRERSFTVAIIDNELPDGASLSIVEEVQAQAPETALVVLASETNMASLNKAIEVGADDYVIKGEHIVPDLMLRIPLAIRHHHDRLKTRRARSLTTVKLPAAPSELGNEQYAGYLKETERAYIEKALALCNGEISLLSRTLGVARSTLHKKIAALEIQR